MCVQGEGMHVKGPKIVQKRKAMLEINKNWGEKMQYIAYSSFCKTTLVFSALRNAWKPFKCTIFS